jgi:N-acetylglucosamine kinase-like BadF-type ATPase
MHYYLGVDVGGTKTAALIADENGQALGYGVSGPGNWEMVALEGFKAAVRTAVDQALAQAGHLALSAIQAAGFGVAGYDWPSQRQMLLDALSECEFKMPLVMFNDAALGIPAGAREGWGVSVVSGTGYNCRGWNKDHTREGRAVGGGDEWSGEGAGGYNILNRAMRAVAFEWTRRGPPTALTQAFQKKTGARDLDELVEGFYLRRYNFDSSFVLTVFQIAAQGDPEALEVMRWAGDQLGQLACGVIRQVGLEKETFDVVQIGSIYDGHPLISECMRATILPVAPKSSLVRLKAPPVIGGTVLGMEIIFGKAAYLRRDKLTQTTRALLGKE